MNRYSAAVLLVAAASVAVSASPANSRQLAQPKISATKQASVHRMPVRVQRSVSSTSTFIPPNIPGLTLWLDAADSSTLVQSGGKLSQWNDKSGAGFNVAQNVSSARPTVVPGALNGNANVAFDGVASYLLSAGPFTPYVYPASTTFVVASGASSSNNEATLWTGASIAGYPRWGYGIPSGTGSAIKLFFGSTSDQLIYPPENVTSPAIYDGGESTSTQTGFINYNGAPVGSISGNITGDSTSNPLSVGARYQMTPAQVGDYFKGNVAEALVYHASLTTAQIQQVEGYLACKWGLQSSLPASHPYRNSCSGGPPPPVAVDVDTYHNDAFRSGWNSNETTLKPSNVGTASFAMIANPAVDGLTFTQPLVAAAVSGAGNRNLVITGTNNDTLYAFDANTGAPVWKRSFLSSGVTTVGIAFTGCDNTGQEDGLLSTPVIDRSTDTMYVVAATMEPHHIHFRLHALALATGADKMTNVEIGGSYTAPGGAAEAFNSDVQYQRPALLESKGNIYVGFGSQCDFKLNQLHGWVFAYNASNFSRTGAVNLTPALSTFNPGMTEYGGGVWMSGQGLSADSSGNIYFATGNGTFDGTQNFGESVLKLPPNLSLSGFTSNSFFTPNSVFNDNADDRDLGSGGVMLIPDQNLVVAQGKDGYLTLLNRSNLGGYHAGGPDNALAELSLGGVWAAPAYWKDSTGTDYVLTTGGPLYAVKVGSNSLIKAGQTNVQFPSDNGNGSTPSVSSNGTTAGTAVVWIVQRVANANGGTNVLYAFDPTNLGTALTSFSLGGWPQNDLNPTLVPTVANGKVYVPTRNSLAIFGLH